MFGVNHLFLGVRCSPDLKEARGGSGIALGGLGLICFLSWLSASAEGVALTGGALTAAGLLMLWKPVRQQVPAGCWIAAALWMLGSLLAFLPLGSSTPPEWRESLARVGVDTGLRITPQPSAALGSLTVTCATGLVAIWAACQGGVSRKRLCMGFVAAVVTYALVAWIGPGLLNFRSNAYATFGFFPNRNHTGTLLAMGSMVSLGLLVQGVRWRSVWQIGATGISLIFLLGAMFGLSISRAGVLLLAVGAGLWILLTGPRYLTGHVGKAVALLVGGSLLFFYLLETPVRQRLRDSFGKVTTASGSDHEISLVDRLESIDSRIAIHQDAAAMISDAPWSGWGAGQFVFIFPQYQEQTAGLSASTYLHPESDWLWMATECGIPATLALAALGLIFVIPVLRSIRGGRARALRAGLLVAAVILPFHGFLDVPGHKFSLLWIAAGLLALAAEARPPARFPQLSVFAWRIGAVAVTTLGALIVYGTATGRPLLAIDRSEHLLTEAHAIYQSDNRRSPSEATAAAELADVSLEAGIDRLNFATVLTPLDARVVGLRGMLALHFDDMDELARQSFAIQRSLDPRRINLPLSQAAAWSRIDPRESRDLWLETMRRAKLMEETFPGTLLQTTTYDRILRDARGSAEAVSAAVEVAGGNAVLLRKAGHVPAGNDAKHAP